MPKKAKRNVSTVERSAPAAQVMEVETVGVQTAPAKDATSGARPVTFNRRQTTTEFNPDYTYVVKDLKRIGSLAGIFFVILIALSFIIH